MPWEREVGKAKMGKLMLLAINIAPSFLAGDPLEVQKNPFALQRKIVIVVWKEALSWYSCVRKKM